METWDVEVSRIIKKDLSKFKFIIYLLLVYHHLRVAADVWLCMADGTT